jgi:hypothetical protein
MTAYTPIDPEMPQSLKAALAERNTLVCWRHLQADVIDLVGYARFWDLTAEELLTVVRHEWNRQAVEDNLRRQGQQLNSESPGDRITRLRGCRCKSSL